MLCRYKVVKKKGRKAVDDVAELLLSFADKRTGQIPCGIVYCLSRKETEDLAAQLCKIRQPNGRMLTVRYVKPCHLHAGNSLVPYDFRLQHILHEHSGQLFCVQLQPRYSVALYECFAVLGLTSHSEFGLLSCTAYRHYHASLSPDEREEVQSAWSRDAVKVPTPCCQPTSIACSSPCRHLQCTDITNAVQLMV